MMPQEMDDRDGLCPDAERDSEIDLGRVMDDLNGGEPGEDDAEFDDYSDDDDYEDFGPEVEEDDDFEGEDPDAGDDEPFEGDDDFYDLDDSDDEEDGD